MSSANHSKPRSPELSERRGAAEIHGPLWLTPLAPLLAAALVALGTAAERMSVAAAAGALLGAALLALAGSAVGRRSASSWSVVRALLNAGTLVVAAACLALVWHLLADDFHYRYVWLYSASALPWYLKAANLWGGEEGTLLLMAALCAGAAVRLRRRTGWAAPGAALMAGAFAVAATAWSPFAATPPADLARAESQGLNAHLLSVWMALHPPLVFAAFVAVLAPSGAALEALARGSGEWAGIARRASRLAWLILSAGLVSGMWWAYEDHTFGQFWHWDPVQTAVFVVWALLTAQVHGLRHYRPDGFLGKALPALALAASIAVLGAMAVTRSEALASSHRYVGDTSLPALLSMAALLAVSSAAGLLRARRRTLRTTRVAGDARVHVQIAIALFALMALVGALHLLESYAGAALELARPPSLKPFFETLSRFAPAAEIERLREAFAQFDVDNFGLNRWLVPLAFAICLFGGHAFLSLGPRRVAWPVTGAAGVAALALAAFVHPLSAHYAGTGLTSKHTTDNFFALDALLGSAVYLSIGAVAWGGRMTRRLVLRRVRYYFAPVGLVHLGVALALVGALCASVLDSYGQRVLSLPRDLGSVHRFPDGYRLRIELGRASREADGGYAPAGIAYRAVTQVALEVEEGGSLLDLGTGQTLYRDARQSPGSLGPVRQICAIVDYRYGRYAGDPGYALDPFIHRGLWRDVQVWVPGADFGGTAGDELELPVVIKTFPMMSWLWGGLAIALAASALIVLGAYLPSRSASRPAPPRSSGAPRA